METPLNIDHNASKQERYRQLTAQVQAVMAHESDVVACMANISAMIKEAFGFWWVGFYRVLGEELVLGPFQGPMACTRIAYGRGVCGTSWREDRTIVVDDVETFPGHIACSSASRSEIVVPIRHKGSIVAVLDIDSEHLQCFDAIDAENLEQIADLLGSKWQ